MLLHKSPEKGRIGFFTLLIGSSLLGILLTVVIHKYVTEFMRFNLYKSISILTIFTYILGLFLILIFALLGVLYNRVTKEKSHVSELKNFKDYTDALHRVSSEAEVYNVLYKFIRNIPSLTQTTIFYRNEQNPENVVWQKLNEECCPICNMSSKNCPLIKLGKECIVGSIENDITCTYQLPKYKSGSYICLPLTDTAMPQGIIQLYSKYESYFDVLGIPRVRSYIEIAKLVIGSKRVLQNLNQKASTDKLTKLYNRSYLEPYLESQIEASNLTKHPLSVIMLDLDHFKKVNDNYGHLTGDQVLIYFAEQVLKCVRKTDLVARYGGEEFLVVLPATDTETAKIIAERIRQAVSSNKIPPIKGQQISGISCSLGISTFPIMCDGKESLIKTSDIALYKAKQSGRNCTIVYDKQMDCCFSEPTHTHTHTYDK